MPYKALLWASLISIHAPVKGATSTQMPEINVSMDISIHAPVKGATGHPQARLRRGAISIHAPVKGATSRTGGPTCPTGISIHAPVKGATGRRAHPCRPGLYFNPRSREGSDDLRLVSCALRRKVFQSTLP